MPTVPTDHEILLTAIRGQVAQVNTCLPGRIVSYDEATQTASVALAVMFRRRDPTTDAIVAYEPPIITGAPVAFPSAGAFSITWPLAAGDACLVHFASRSLDEWASVVADVHEPQDLRRFDLSDAIVEPALRSPASPIPAAGYASGAMVLRATEVRLGSSSATLRPVLGSFETDLATWNAGMTALLTALNSGVLATIAAGAATFQPIHAAFVAQVIAGHQATKVKAE